MLLTYKVVKSDQCTLQDLKMQHNAENRSQLYQTLFSPNFAVKHECLTHNNYEMVKLNSKHEKF